MKKRIMNVALVSVALLVSASVFLTPSKASASDSFALSINLGGIGLSASNVEYAPAYVPVYAPPPPPPVFWRPGPPPGPPPRHWRPGPPPPGPRYAPRPGHRPPPGPGPYPRPYR